MLLLGHSFKEAQGDIAKIHFRQRGRLLVLGCFERMTILSSELHLAIT